VGQGGAASGSQTTVVPPSQHPPTPDDHDDRNRPPDTGKSILKRSTKDDPKAKKSVQYTPSTKGPKPTVHKRPPTPDLEVTIRPTSTLDIVDEILAGQPSRRVDGQTIPDTLIQINEPTPVDRTKKAKRQVEPSDRVLRERPSKR
jgi:hypothetical protein